VGGALAVEDEPGTDEAAVVVTAAGTGGCASLTDGAGVLQAAAEMSVKVMR
jgi:hypothetical protein